MAVGLDKQTAAVTEVVLAVQNLKKEFSSKKGPATQALKGVSLKARPGQVTGLVGADGAGKTTLIRTAAGLIVPTEGSVTVLGLDSVVDTIEIQSRVGYMPQKFGLYQDLTVKENMNLYADLQGVPSSQRKDRYGRLLKMTGLEPYTRRMAGALSGGMKQKLGLACSLIKSPQMLLLDEPTVGVDPISRRELWKIVYELVENDGIGVLLSTAYLDEAERCDHVVVLHDGEKLAEGTPREFKERLGQRVALVDPPADIKPRRIHTRLMGRAHIVDATIRSGKVRVVTDVFGTQAVADALPKKWRATIKNTSSTFEDAFMTLIHHQGSRIQIDREKESSEKTILNEDVVVQTKLLRKFFGDFEAVKSLTFEVHHGEIFGLLGPNGAGKSTTFRMLCGLLS
ncbi:MAG: ATP-binding cassette domain-containing protein, partial [Desulfobacterales bacterium]